MRRGSISLDNPHMLRCRWSCQIVVADERTKIEWLEIGLEPIAFKIVSQLSSRVFLGEELCRNEDWLQVTVDYTRDSMIASQDLRQ